MYLSRMSQLSVPHPRGVFGYVPIEATAYFNFEILGGDVTEKLLGLQIRRVTSPSHRQAAGAAFFERPMPMKVPTLRSGELLDRSHSPDCSFGGRKEKLKKRNIVLHVTFTITQVGIKHYDTPTKSPTGVNGEKLVTLAAFAFALVAGTAVLMMVIRSRLSRAPPGTAVVRTIQPQSAVASESMTRLNRPVGWHPPP